MFVQVFLRASFYLGGLSNLFLKHKFSPSQTATRTVIAKMGFLVPSVNLMETNSLARSSVRMGASAGMV